MANIGSGSPAVLPTVKKPLYHSDVILASLYSYTEIPPGVRPGNGWQGKGRTVLDLPLTPGRHGWPRSEWM